MANSHLIGHAPTVVHLDPDIADKIAATQACLNCGLPPVSDVTVLNRGVILANYLCPVGHIWSAKAVAA